jgi:hypothetical protein
MGRLSDRIDELFARVKELEKRLHGRGDPGRPPTRLMEAMEWLDGFLDRPTKYAEIDHRSRLQGFSAVTVRTAAKKLGVVREKGWWSIPGRNMTEQAKRFLVSFVERPMSIEAVLFEARHRGIKKADVEGHMKRLDMVHGPLVYPVGKQPKSNIKWTPGTIRRWTQDIIWREPARVDRVKQLLKANQINFQDWMDANEGVVGTAFDRYYIIDEEGEVPVKIAHDWIYEKVMRRNGKAITVTRSDIMKDLIMQGLDRYQAAEVIKTADQLIFADKHKRTYKLKSVYRPVD